MNIEVGASFIQADRILRIETPLGLDVLLPEKMEMDEGVNGLFALSISVRSKRGDIKPDELVGKLIDVSVEVGRGARRTWNGMVVELTAGPPVTRGLRAYHLLVQPQHWLMTQRSDCRIWLDKTSVEVAQMLCSEHGLHAPVTAGVVDAPKPQHYSVQWNETDFAYLTRRLEEDGIFYWFEHEGGAPGSVAAKHTLHIASNTMGYTQGDDTDVRFAAGSTDRNHISKFEQKFRFVPGKRSASDWNFLTPGGVPRGETPGLFPLPGNAAYDLYEYPAIGGYGTGSASAEVTAARVEAQSKLRMQAAEAEHEKVDGLSTVRTLSPGRRFKPYDVVHAASLFEEHVVTRIVHTARDRSFETQDDGDPEYSNRFQAIPSRVPATPHRTTPRPRVEGTQIAIIAGPEGEEIHPDEHGRVKVWFPWDRRAKKDGTDTCWIRVMQNWAGPGWGGQIIPRIDMEAIVTYLDGDPDKPVIIGLVPNTRQKVPYPLPENKTKSVFRTNTHKSKDKWQMNELSFEDKEGNEEIFIHAQKDRNEKTLNNHTERVDNNWLQSIGHDKAIQVENNHDEVIGGNASLNIGAPRLFNFLLPSLLSNWSGVGFAAQKITSFAASLPTRGNWIINVQNSIMKHVGYAYTRSIGDDLISNVGKNESRAIGENLDVSVGGNSVENVNGIKILQADDQIELEAGGSSIHLFKDGTILIDAKNLLIDIEENIEINGARIDIN